MNFKISTNIRKNEGKELFSRIEITICDNKDEKLGFAKAIIVSKPIAHYLYNFNLLENVETEDSEELYAISCIESVIEEYNNDLYVAITSLNLEEKYYTKFITEITAALIDYLKIAGELAIPFLCINSRVIPDRYFNIDIYNDDAPFNECLYKEIDTDVFINDLLDELIEELMEEITEDLVGFKFRHHIKGNVIYPSFDW